VGPVSDYHLTNQVTACLEPEIVWRLAIKPSHAIERFGSLLSAKSNYVLITALTPDPENLDCPNTLGIEPHPTWNPGAVSLSMDPGPAAFDLLKSVGDVERSDGREQQRAGDVDCVVRRRRTDVFQERQTSNVSTLNVRISTFEERGCSGLVRLFKRSKFSCEESFQLILNTDTDVLTYIRTYSQGSTVSCLMKRVGPTH